MKTVTFRMPRPLSDKLQLLVDSTGIPRNQLLEIALRALLRQVKARGGVVFPSYSAHFAAAEVERVRAHLTEKPSP